MDTFAAPKYHSKNGWDVMIDNLYPFIGIPNYIAHLIAKNSGAQVRVLTCFHSDHQQHFSETLILVQY